MTSVPKSRLVRNDLRTWQAATSAWTFDLQVSNLWVSHPARLRYGRNDAMTSPGARKVMPVRSR
jgi:hypothetical protein